MIILRSFKKIIRKIHLWLGLLAGLIVVISLLPAAVFVWEKELNEWYHHDKLFVPKIGVERLPLDSLLHIARSASPQQHIGFVNIDNNPGRSFAFVNYAANTDGGWTWASTINEYSKIYVDPYSGNVLGTIDLRYDWIFNMRMLHQCLLLNYDVGHYIVGAATLIVLIMVITGIILWWPKNNAALKQRLWFRWKNTTKWKRKNYDWHNIIGFYSSLFIIFFALTGLTWTFDWWENTVLKILGNKPDKRNAMVSSPATSKNNSGHVLQNIFTDASRDVQAWKLMNIVLAKDSTKNHSVTVKYSPGKSGWDESDQLYYHPQTGERLSSVSHDEKSTAAKWKASNYAMHVGNIYGLPTKILATGICLFCASLPVTGFLIWMGRKKRKT